MKTTALIRSMLALPFGLLLLEGLVSKASAENEAVRFALVSSAEVILSGTSSLHNWSCEGDRINLVTRIALLPEEFQAAADAAWAGRLPSGVDFESDDRIDGSPLGVSIPVDSLECSRARMQRDLRDAVRFEDYPEIDYVLRGIVETTLSENGDPRLIMVVAGDLTVAGVTRRVEHEVIIRRVEIGHFEVQGKLDLKMTWFEMEPPTALLGLLRAHDDFSVSFYFKAHVLGI